MDMSFAEWLYSHMRMYKDNSVHDDTMTTVTFDGKEYTIQEAVDWIIENTGEFKWCWCFRITKDRTKHRKNTFEHSR